MTMPLFNGMNALPGLSEALSTITNQFWWGRFENQIWAHGAIIDGAARDAQSAVTTILREGLLLGRVTTTKKLKQWDPTATDGTQFIYGILSISQPVTNGSGTDVDRFLGYVMLGGLVKAANLIQASLADSGIANTTYEHVIRAQMAGRFTFDDNPGFTASLPTPPVVAKTANYTVLEADNGTHFTNRGASGAVTFTLPATAKRGLRYLFTVVADQNVTIAGGTADTLVVLNDATADSVTLSTANEKIGGSFEVVGDGTGWLVVPRLYEAQTVTIVT